MELEILSGIEANGPNGVANNVFWRTAYSGGSLYRQPMSHSAKWTAISTVVLLSLGCGGASKASPTSASPSELESPKENPEKSAHLVVLIQGNFLFMGNDTYETVTDENDKIFVGAYSGLVSALDVAREAGPSNARVELSTYGEKVTERFSGPLEDLTGAMLGKQRQFDGISSSLNTALIFHTERLLAIEGNKVLVIISDGKDVQYEFDAGPHAVALKDAGVRVFTIHYSPDASRSTEDGEKNLATLGFSASHKAVSRNDFTPLLATVIRAGFRSE